MNHNMMFGTRESTLFLASRFLGMLCLAIWMLGDVTVSMFDLIWYFKLKKNPRNIRCLYLVYFKKSYKNY